MTYTRPFLQLFMILLFGMGILAERQAIAEDKNGEKALLLLAEEATREAITLRRLDAKQPIQTRVTTKKEVQDYIQKRFEETDARQEFATYAEMLRLLGVFEEKVALDKIMEELLVEQVAGYYDWEKKTLYIADWLPSVLQKPTLVHEVVHALQDQHFRLGRFLAPMKGYSDPLGAIQCLFEGDATVVMIDSMAAGLGIKGGIPPGMETMLVRLLESEMVQEMSTSSGLGDVPPILGSMLLFPYLGGLKMVLHVRRKGGWEAVDALYQNLPLSTEQILHPEKLTGKKRDNPQDIRYALPAALASAGWRALGSDSLGEFSLREVLAHHLGDTKAKEAAAGWDGDRYTLIQQGENGPTALLWVSEWDSEEEAAEAEQALQSTAKHGATTVRRKTRIAGIWGGTVPNAQTITRELLKSATADELDSFETVVQRGRQ